MYCTVEHAEIAHFIFSTCDSMILPACTCDMVILPACTCDMVILPACLHLWHGDPACLPALVTWWSCLPALVCIGWELFSCDSAQACNESAFLLVRLANSNRYLVRLVDFHRSRIDILLQLHLTKSNLLKAFFDIFSF